MNRKYETLGLLLVLVMTLTGLPEALAGSGYLDAFNTKYDTVNTKLDTCDTCHVYGSNARNLYGQDVEIQLRGGATTTLIAGGPTSTLTIDQALTNVEPKDSDGDTYSNIGEIKALTFPGNISDHPAANVTFVVTDSLKGFAIQGASVVMEGIKINTNATGTAVFTNVTSGDHMYTVTKTKYKRFTGFVSMTGDTTIYVKLVLR